MKLTFHLPVVAALALAGVVLGAPVTGSEDTSGTCICTEGGAPDADAGLIRKAADIIQTTLSCMAEIQAALEGVEDQAGADAAADRVAAGVAGIRKQMALADAMNDAVRACDGFDEALEAELAARGVEVEQIRNVPEDLKPVYARLKGVEPPFYGSGELQAAVREYVDGMGLAYILDDGGDIIVRGYDEGDDDDERVEGFTEEQLEQAHAAVETLAGLVQEGIDVLQTVKDKESADAAAVKMAEIKKRMDGLQKQAREGGYADAAEVLLDDALQGEMGRAVQESNDLVETLMDMDPPFYGSEALWRLWGEDDEEE